MGAGGAQAQLGVGQSWPVAVDPEVLLLDEPFGALDAKVREDLRAWLRRLHAADDRVRGAGAARPARLDSDLSTVAALSTTAIRGCRRGPRRMA